MQILNEQALNASVPLHDLTFKTTKDLINPQDSQPHLHGWIAQAEAKKAAMFGLRMRQAGFNMLVLGQHGSGRTSLMQSAMQQVAKEAGEQLSDLVAVYHFNQKNHPFLIKLPAGLGMKLSAQMDVFSRAFIVELPALIVIKDKKEALSKAEPWLACVLDELVKLANGNEQLTQYIELVKKDVLTFLKIYPTPANNDVEGALEALMSDGFLNRFKVNVLVDNRAAAEDGFLQPVIYDNDPSYQSLFGSLETGAEQTHEFMRLRAGKLHKADGGMLLVQLRDILNDEQNGAQMIEKLYRFLRNGTLQFEDAAGSGQSAGYVLANTLIPLRVKLVLVAMREDFYSLLEENPDFFDHFPIKVEFADSINANAENYAAVAGYVAQKCEQHQCAHFNAEAVATLIGALQRLEEDQARISTNFAFLERLMLESASYAGDADVVKQTHVQAAINARNQRHQYFETQIRESIIDNELLIQVHGEVVGQINGLTHIELGDASFGSPIRITARCYPGQKGLINIDREVNMSGPNHDKGIFILQNWLSASFSHLAPLSLNASLVFEQEYNGVEGDSASCAELFALLSAMANLPIQQGIAITGALNQFGEVMPIGGVNEKIEGYFRVCKALGLDGKQGVIIPKRNQRHLLLDDEVVQAVKEGQFQIITIDHVLEGIEHLVNVKAGEKDASGSYAPNTVMGHAQAVLAEYRKTLETNQPNGKQH
ncbi:MAG: AAA family ATPase [Betaproteobacteria bacterium]|nr:AAA family ATPase [Betaproteobacteria bacterium]